MPIPRPTISHPISPPPLDAKLVVLGAQGVGKTSLVSRYLEPHKPLQAHPSTVGASFVTKKITDVDSSTTVRLQIWDTAGQERFRSISRLYYRGAHVGLLCYDVTDEASWEEMKGWLRELRENCHCDGEDGLIIHVVGTKGDIVAQDPAKRQVPFERTISYVTEQLSGLSQSNTPSGTLRQGASQSSQNNPPVPNQYPDSKRSSGFWGHEFNMGWDSCHEVNAQDGEGVEEVFRVIARKLIEQRNRRDDLELARMGQTPGFRSGRSDSGDDYFNNRHGNITGSFRLGHGDKRRSWLGLPSVGLGIGDSNLDGDSGRRYNERDVEEAKRRGKCC